MTWELALMTPQIGSSFSDSIMQFDQTSATHFQNLVKQRDGFGLYIPWRRKKETGEQLNG